MSRLDRIDDRILFIGAGNMARALVSGGCGSKVIEPTQVAGVDPNPDQGAHFDTFFINATDGMRWLGESKAGQVMVLAVKPQMLGEAAEPVRKAMEELGTHPLVISILAGIHAQRIHDELGGLARVVRVMPNTPAAISMGMNAIARGPGATDADMQLAMTLLGSVGETMVIDESLMDAFTGLAGSGPAYVFYLAEAMTKAAIEMGFTNEQARLIVAQTIAGSGMLLRQSPESAQDLRAMVTSKGGTTAAGTNALDEGAAMATIFGAVLAARDRGVELGRG
ncbi:MAG: pyrroline-5-carboxylate reductase [Phycisphaerales bacterium]|nr:pyrroline-5-carboxylate reductase [Phycisphaerales bacterium]